MQLVSEGRMFLETVPSDFTAGPNASLFVSEVGFTSLTLIHGNIVKERRMNGWGVVRL